MLKKSICLLISICMLASVSLAVSVSASFSLSAESAILIDANTLEVIYENNAYAENSMASTTKIMTAVIALESGRLDESVTITDEMVAVEGTSLGLMPGDIITLHDLVKGMMLTSGNDSANTIAIFLSDSLDKFAVTMNEKSKEIGMKSSSFVTPSGLDDDNHYTTAYDMSLLTAYALQNKMFRDISSSRSAEIYLGNPPQKRTVYNHNRLLKSYDGAIGVKTGFTKKSGRCLVSAAERKGVRIIAVTLNAPDDWNDHKKLLDYGFENTDSISLSEDIGNLEAVVVGSDISKIDTYFPDMTLNFAGSIEKSEFEKKIYLKRFYYAPIKKDDILGKIVYTYKGKEISAVEIKAKETAKSCGEKTESVFAQLF